MVNDLYASKNIPILYFISPFVREKTEVFLKEKAVEKAPKWIKKQSNSTNSRQYDHRHYFAYISKM